MWALSKLHEKRSLAWTIAQKYFKYRPDVDGLRAIAVLVVIFYHAHLSCPGGYVGVDVFFVISGFLITSIILKKLKDGTFSYLEFWERRVRRLVPALLVLTVFTALTSYFVLLPADLIDLGGALIAQPLLMANVYFWRVVQGGYFGDPPEIRPLLHTWSLGVEEQFYVVYPFLILALWGSVKRRSHIGKALFLITLASFSLGVVLTPLKSVAAFFNLPTRAWELLVGALLVFLPSPSPRFRESLSLLGGVFIGYAVFFFHKNTPFPGTAALVPCVGSALIIWSNPGPQRTAVGRALSNPLMVKIGLASYSLYLWHWPLMAYGDYTGLMATTEAKILIVILSFWLGFLSWRWVEIPFRDHVRLQSRRSVLLLFIVYAAASGSLGLWYRANDGFPGNWSEEALAMSKIVHDLKALQSTDVNLASPEYQPRYIGDTSQEFPAYLIWGDSHARALIPLFDELGRDFHQKGIQFTGSGKPPLLGYEDSDGLSKRWESLVGQVVRREQIRVVFLVGFWSHYDLDKSQLTQTLEYLQASGVEHCVFVEDVPQMGFEPPRVSAISTRVRNLPLSFPTSAEHYVANRLVGDILREVAIENNFLVKVDPAPLLLELGSAHKDGVLLYADKHHLTVGGALLLRPAFELLFSRMTSYDREFSQGSAREQRSGRR